ncbi:MAG: cyclase family protein [Euryarchaeota archaeon]|nr:cyclase family protein [Euryarchaeota archaeon]
MIDLSYPIYENMPVFPHDPKVEIKRVYTFKLDGFFLSKISGSTHMGTHLDAPFHFNPEGRKISQINLDELIGIAQLVEVSDKKIEIKHLRSAEKDDMLILKTNWSHHWGEEEYFLHNPFLTEQAANFLVKKRIRGIGIDSPSLDPPDSFTAHRIFLFNDIWIVENLRNLEMIKGNEFKIYIIPLVLDAESSPVRAFAEVY